MNVVLAAFDPVPAPKGASAHVLANARALLPDHDVALVTLGDAPAPGLRHRVVRPRGENWLRRATDFHRQCREILGQVPVDVLHARSPFEGLAAPPGARRIAEVNALYSVELPYHYPALADHAAFREQMRALEVTWLEQADLLLTPSPVTAAYLDDLGFPDARVVPNAPSVPRPEAPLRIRRPARRAPPRLRGPSPPGRASARCWRLLPAPARPRPAPHRVHGERPASGWPKRAAKRGIADRVTVRDALPPSALGAALAERPGARPRWCRASGTSCRAACR
ncbi:MAG: glycosyltransferase family 4 protein [Myxococcota bacterium]